MNNGIKSALLFLSSTLVCLVVLEISARTLMEVRILSQENWRISKIIPGTLGSSVRDSELGWIVAPHIKTGYLNTIEHGIRKNGPHTRLTTGGILAVGDSFTAGSDVYDHESWPAFLEQKTGKTVINAGTGAYGTDQIVMRAERLLPIVMPEILIVGFLQDDIARAGYSSFGAPKPHFTLEDGELRYHAPSLNSYQDNAGNVFVAFSRFVRDWGGFSAFLHLTLGNLWPEFWLSSDGHVFTQVATDVADVTCALLRRLKAKTDASGTRTLLFMQYGGAHHSRFRDPTSDAELVIECARSYGIQVVDESESLQAIARRDQDELRTYYLMRDDAYGHMTAKGNEHAADLLAAALQEPVPQPVAATAAPAPIRAHVAAVDGLEERLHGTGILEVERKGIFGTYYRLTAVGPPGEHYSGTGEVASPPGISKVSLEVRPAASAGRPTRLRVQLWSGAGEAVISDFHLTNRQSSLMRVGTTRQLQSSIEAGSGNWLHAVVSGSFQGSGRNILIQLLDADGQPAFTPAGESLEIRSISLR